MNKLFKQMINFIGYSGIGWVLDFSCYTILSLFCSNLFLDNAIGAIAGVTFVFVFSTRHIFKNNSKIPLGIKYFIYILYQIVLIYLVSKLLVYINDTIINCFAKCFIVNFSAVLSKIFITPITMILNFFIMKGLVEKV